MTSPDDHLTYSAFCGAFLDQMLEQIVQNMITRSLFDEKVVRRNYGTVDNPKFYDPQPLANKKENRETAGSCNKPVKIVDSDSEDSDDAKDIETRDKDLSNEPDIGRFCIHLNGKDVYTNALADNKKFLGDRASSIVVGTAQDTYFKCSNCDRKIAGSRFGAHIDKCLGGRSRK